MGVCRTLSCSFSPPLLALLSRCPLTTVQADYFPRNSRQVDLHHWPALYTGPRMCCQVAQARFPLLVALLDITANRLGMTSMRIRTALARAPQLPMPHAPGLCRSSSLSRFSLTLLYSITKTYTASTTTSSVITVRGWAEMSTLSSNGYLEPPWEGAIASGTPVCPLVAAYCLWPEDSPRP